MLGEFGAEVLKVEHPIAGDPMRRFGTQTKRHDATLAWLSEARGKKSVTIDLRQPPGVELFIKLVAKAEIGMPIWQDLLYIFMSRMAADPSDFYHLPRDRVVELGSQVAV